MKPSTSLPPDDSRDPLPQPNRPSPVSSQSADSSKRKQSSSLRSASASSTGTRPVLPTRGHFSSRQHVISPLAQQPSTISPPTVSPHSASVSPSSAPPQTVAANAQPVAHASTGAARGTHSPQPPSGISRPNQPRFQRDSAPVPAVTDRGSLRKATSTEAVLSSVSPSLHAAFESPTQTGPSTSSTESAGSTESARTVKGFANRNASNIAVRTPSYPFPYVHPQSSRKWSGPIHQPFTNLSPTAQAAGATYDHGTMRDRYLSVSSTPGDPASCHFAPGEGYFGPEDDRFPTPNLSDLVLQINAEPTLEAWWSQLVTVVQQWYKADRAQLSLPADSTDIENVPWGLKAAWNATGLTHKGDKTPHANRAGSISSIASRDEPSKKTPKGAAQTSPVTSRCSRKGRQPSVGAGNDSPDINDYSNSTRKDSVSTSSGKNAGSRRASGDNMTQNTQTQESWKLPSESDFAMADDSKQDQRTSRIFGTLQALEYEVETLLDTTSVNRILERNKVVVLTREYVTQSEETRSSGDDLTTSAKGKSTSGSSQKTDSEPRGFGRAGYFRGQGDATASPRFHYEEYEQAPTSPWSQSPAPSPAIQANADENPFFSNVEASFSPDTAKEDYSEYENVEAIGVDQAATIIHIPLIHPFNSWTLGAASADSDFNQTPLNDIEGQQRDSSRRPMERKAPLAILTLYSRTVPYPRNLQDSLKYFSPHLATALNTSLQIHIMQHQILARQSALARSFSPSGGIVTGLGLGLDELLRNEGEDGSSSATLGSIASPSEWSGRSRPSPGSFLMGTPGLEFPNTGRPSRTGTPGTAPVMEPSESYFEPKQRVALSRSKSTTVVTQQQRTSPRSSFDHRGVLGRIEEPSTPLTESPSAFKPRDKTQGGLETHAISDAQEANVEERTNASSQAHRRSLLHSYGADFAASFQILPSATGSYHGRAVSTSDVQEMPPPSERLLRTIIDALPVQIFTASPRDGHITWVNSKFLVYRGHGAKEAIDDPWEAMHPQDTAEYLDAWRRCLESGSQFQRKLRIRRFDGVYRWFYVRAAPLRDKKQNIVHWIGTYVDFHDQHLAEVNSAKQQETAASEAKYRALANSSPQIVFAATRSRGIIFCNTQWLEYSGQSEEQALKVGFLEMVHPDDIVKCKLPIFDAADGLVPNVPVSVPPPKPYRSASGLSSELSSETSDSGVTVTGYSAQSPSEMPQRKLSELASRGILKVSRDSSGKPSYSTEVRLLNKFGEYRWHLVRVLLAEPIISEENEEETWYGSCADINDHKELESQLKETMDAKGRFLSNMSHEIRTPLHGIHGMTNMLMDTHLSDEQMDQVNTIRASAEGLRDLINDILDLSKVEAGMITLNKDWLDIRGIIEEVDDLTAALATDKGIELNYIVDNDVPATTRGDKYRIRQVLLNVIGNAIKFTERGEVLVRCQRLPDEVEASDSLMLLFSVHDTGKGFTEKEAERLFKRFSQIDGSSTRQHGGTGLGLVISMQLVELHGGIMSANSVPGKGSVFSFTLEVGVPTVEEEGTPLERSDSSNPLGRVAPDELAVRSSLVSPSPLSSKQMHQIPSPQISAQPPARLVPTSSSGSDPSSAETVVSRGSLSNRSSSSSIAYSQDQVQKSAPIAGLSRPSSVTAGLPVAAADETNRRASVIRVTPPLFNILVVASLQWTREATVKHVESVLAPDVPHHISSVGSLKEAHSLLEPRDGKVNFTHILVAVPGTQQLVEIILSILSKPSLSKTSLVAISSLPQKKEVIAHAPNHNVDQLISDGRLSFIFKPLKPSKLVSVFDPSRSHAISIGRSNHVAAVQNQRQLFDEMIQQLGNRNIRALVVEDNLVNQKLLTKLLQRISLLSDIASDGVECLKRFHEKPIGYYSIILCDLHMPNKDGYQTCSELRQWERENKQPHTPIVALSANVLGDVQVNCERAGFDEFLTKPIEFRDFSRVMTTLLGESRQQNV